MAVVRAQDLCLLERLAQLGPGARAAAHRRQAEEGKRGIYNRQPGPRDIKGWKSFCALMCIIDLIYIPFAFIQICICY